MLLCIINVNAQSKPITGQVLNKDGIGISGASIKVKTTKGGTYTNATGIFSINAEKGVKLVISSIGFYPQEILVGDVNNITIVLKDDETKLTDVIVTAYGIKKETKRLGYTVQEVKGADLVKARDANPINSLAGKIAGLSVGASPEMLARPELVLRGSKDLLFVVDGVPVNTDTWNVSPDDIETYTVLKGVNAAALYGYRGSNGAIIITTKRGTNDKKGWQVELNTSTVFEKGLIAEPQSQTEYGRGKAMVYSYGDVLYDNKQRLPEWGPRFEGQPIQQYDSPYDLTTGIRTATPWTARGADNYHKFLQTGIVNSNNISLSAGTDKSDIRISLSNMNQKGVAPNTKLNIYNLLVNTGYNLTSKFRIEASVNLNKQQTPNIPDVNYGPNSYLYMFKVYGSADYNIDDLKDIYKGPQGVQNLIPYAQEYGRENSAWFIAKTWMHSHDKTDVNGYVKGTYKFNKNLSASFRSQISTWNQLRTEKVAAGTNLNTYTPWYYFGWNGDYREDRRSLTENNSDVIFNFDKKFKNFSLSALAGGAVRDFKYNSFYGTTKGLSIANLYSLSNTKDPLSYSWGSNMEVKSAFYSVDFTFRKLFTLSTTGRVDDISTLPKPNNRYFYPSVSLSTVLSDYIKLPAAISFAKLRSSFAEARSGGLLSSSTVPSAYTQVTGNSTNQGLLGYGTDLLSSYDGPSYGNQNSYAFQTYYNGTPSVGFSSTIANQNIKPENKKSYEFGFDMKFLKNRIGFDLTYFGSNRGLLINQSGLSSSTSYQKIYQNAVITQKKGIEFSLSGTPVKIENGLRWDVLFNYATLKETLKQGELDKDGNDIGTTQNGHTYKVGDRLDALYDRAFVRDGSGNVINAGGLAIAPPSGDNNKAFLGNLNSNYSFGVNNKFSYKNFSFSFQFDGRIGGKIWDEIYKDGMNGGTAIETTQGDFGAARLGDWNAAKANGGSYPAGYTGSYVAPGVKIVSGIPKYANGQITNMSDLTFAPNDVHTTLQNYITGSLTGVTEYWMVDRSFVKLREVIFGYTLPSKLIARVKAFKAVSISFVGRNLLYFAKRTDIDSDQFPSGYNDSDRSLNGTSGNGALQSPSGRRFGFNLNLTF